MKRILIISHAMEIGGAERALLGLLDSFDYAKYRVDLFLLRHTGELLPYINSHVNILPEILPYSCLAIPVSEVVKRCQLGVAFGRLLGKYKAMRYVKKVYPRKENSVAIEYSHKYTKRYMPLIQPDVEYDLVISFLTPHYFAAEKVRAKKKVAWIHTDYSVVKVDTASELKMWGGFDWIVSISEKVSESFLSTFPTLKDRLIVIGNILPVELIRTQADAFSAEREMKADCIRLLSLGRFCAAKNFDNIPFICKKVLESDLNVRWYLIGYGGDEQLIRQKITEAGMENRVVILGKKENPYPYIKACDLYIQPSRYEGKCVTVKEAQLLGKPVVITNYATSASQLEDGIDGAIVPMDNDDCAKGIVNILRDPERMQRLSANCKARNYTNSSEIEKIYAIVGDIQ